MLDAQDRLVVGLDLSLTCSGYSDGTKRELIKTSPDNSLTRPEDLRRRTSYIVGEIQRFVLGHGVYREVLAVIEAPMATPGANHLLEFGWLEDEVYKFFWELGCNVKIIDIPPSTLKKWATGKGNTKKDEVKNFVKERWGVEFARDPGHDLAHAECLYRYGLAVLAGETDHKLPARRGSKRK